MGRALASAAVALVLAGPALAAPGVPPVMKGPLGPPQQRLAKGEATRIFLQDDKVADWLRHYPPRLRQTEATYGSDEQLWTVKVWAGEAGEVATGKVDDTSGAVVEAWTGPQVAWKMARGSDGAFGGREINSAPVWLGFCLLFLVGLADLRRPLSVRNLDLLALLSFSVSLWFFNRGDIFTSVPLVYAPMLYLLARCLWIGVRGRPARSSRPVWPAMVLLGGAVFLGGFKIAFNFLDSNVIDVGYAGV